MKHYSMHVWLIIITVLVISGFSLGFLITTTTAFPENPGTYNYFTQISEMPYKYTKGPHPETFWTEGGDCDDRTRVFYNYLKSKGAANVQICWMARLDDNGKMVPSSDGGMGHEFLVWNNRAYYPSVNESRRYYDADLNEYLAFMKNLVGFNTFYYENSTEGIPF